MGRASLAPPVHVSRFASYLPMDSDDTEALLAEIQALRIKFALELNRLHLLLEASKANTEKAAKVQSAVIETLKRIRPHKGVQ